MQNVSHMCGRSWLELDGEELQMDHPNGDANLGKSPKPGYSKLVPAVEQASQILFCLARGAYPRLSLTEICRQVGIHKSKGYSILNTLMESGLVVRDPAARTYALGPGLLFLSRSVLDRMDLKDIVSPYLAELAEATHSTALLGLISAEQVFIVAKHEAQADIGITIRVGHRYPLTWGAHGKAVVAFLPAELRNEVLASQSLHFFGQTAGKELRLDSIEEELEECRRLGYAKDLGQVQPGIHAVSAPLFGAGSIPIGCVIVVGTFPAAMAEPFGEQATATAQKISTLLGRSIESVYGLKAAQRMISQPG
jgi:DNA-binding IclR family transcriptional regulator